MSYASQGDIQGEFKSLDVTTNTVLTAAKITGFLTDADGEINARLATIYQVPVTGTQALLICKQIAILLVKHRINEILKTKTGKNSEDQESGKSYRDQGLDMIKDIIARKMILTDATAATSAEGIRSYSNDNIDSVPYKFDRGAKQW